MKNFVKGLEMNHFEKAIARLEEQETRELAAYVAEWLNEEKARLLEMGIDRPIESQDLLTAFDAFQGGAR